MWKRVGALLALVVALALVAVGCGSDSGGSSGTGGSDPGSSESAGADELNVLAWEGYAEPEWVEKFEQEQGVTVNVTYIGTTDEMVAKLRGQGGSAYDVLASEQGIAINEYAKQGMVVPLDEAKLELDELAPVFKDTPSLFVGGERYGVPFIWGSTGLGYSVEEFSTPPDSWSAIFDPSEEHCGKIIWSADPEVMTASAALYLGYEEPFALTDEELDEVERVLKESRGCTVALYSGLADGGNFYASGTAVLGFDSTPLIAKAANDAGADVAEVIPKEGALHWLDCWAVTPAGAEKGDLVYDWINFELTPEVQTQIVNLTSQGPAITGIADEVEPEIAELLHLDDPSWLEQFTPYAPYEAPDSREKHLDVFNAVRSGA